MKNISTIPDTSKEQYGLQKDQVMIDLIDKQIKTAEWEMRMYILCVLIPVFAAAGWVLWSFFSGLM